MQITDPIADLLTRIAMLALPNTLPWISPHLT